MNPKLDTTSRRFAFAIFVSLILHGLVLWGPNIHVPRVESSLPPLTAKLQALPSAGTTKPKPKKNIRHAARQADPQPAVPQAEPVPQDIALGASDAVAASMPAAISAPVVTNDPIGASGPTETSTLDSENKTLVERPPLPRRAQLTFNIYWGTGGGLIGEVVHTLEIDDGRYVLHAVTRTVGLTRLFKRFEMTQYSSGTYDKRGLRPEQYVEERKESSDTQRITAEFDHTAHLARFSNGKEMALPPDTLDLLSNLYQFPPLQGETIAPVSVSNGKKIERYSFEITPDEEIETPMGKLLTVRLHKMHGPNEEGLDIWLAREYRLFPVKIRFIEKNGDVTGEAVITDIRVSEEQGVRSDAVN